VPDFGGLQCLSTDLGLELRGLGQTGEPRQRLISRHPLIRVAAMSAANSTVLVIDDDPDVRASVGRLLRSLGMDVQLFAAISDFLKSDYTQWSHCCATIWVFSS
jgi:hypothetical protein